jgi:hypothetical protein
MITFVQLGHLGRLGNQMFQYAALRGLALEKCYESKIPNPSECEWHGQKCLLGEFSIESAYLEAEDLHRIKFRYQEPDYMTFDPNFYGVPDNCDLVGFFQSIHYFENHQDQIKKELTPKEAHIERAKKIFEGLKKDNPSHEIVSLHIRRGDNTDHTDPSQIALREFFDEGCGFDEYVERATKMFKDKKIKYLVFTGGKRWSEDNNEDIEWCRNRLGEEDFIFSEGRSPLEDFCLIMQCDHHIISPASSFGWWAAYLADKEDKVIVAPRKYHPDRLDIDYRPGFYPQNWRLV